MRRIHLYLLLALLFANADICTAQSNGVPGNILGRTVYLRVAGETGTGFVIDYKNNTYVVTARHVVSEVATKGSKLQIYRSGEWRDLEGDLIFPKNKNIDIAVIDLHAKASTDHQPDISDVSPTIGGQVYFLGYPHGLHSLYNNGEYLPLVKVGVFSGLDNANREELLFYIDGFNNPGFSGGPIVFMDNERHQWHFWGVIKGYKPESIKTIVKGKPVDTGLLANSGILIAYPARAATEAIDLALKK